MNRALSVVWRHRMAWMPIVVLTLVLIGTFLLVPKQKAPFIYAFF